MSEREKIVAWLRDNAQRKARESRDTTRAKEISCLSMQGAYAMAADAIERGDHLVWKPEPTIPFEQWRDKPSVG